MSATQMHSITSKMFHENSLEEKRCFWSSFAFVFTWFLFTLFLCGALSVFLHIEFSQNLTQDVTVNIENYKKKLESNVRVMLHAEIQNMRDEIETELQKMRDEMAEKLRTVVASIDNQKPVQRSKDLSNSENSDHGERNSPTAKIKNKYNFEEVLVDELDDGPVSSEYDSSDDQSSEIRNDGSTRRPLPESVIINEKVFKRNVDIDSFYKPSPEISIFKTGDRSDQVKDLFKPEKNAAPESQTTVKSSRSPMEKFVKERTAKSGFANAESTLKVQQQSKLEKNDDQNKIMIDGEEVENAEMIFSHGDRKKPSLAYLKMTDFKGGLAEVNQAESQDYTQALRKVVVAAHFKADSTSFKTQKQYYKKNDLVRHPTGEYNEWKVDDWHNEFQTSKHLNYTKGSVVVQNSGLYFVYGQIYYTEWADINGFVILKNNDTALQCVTSTYGDRTKQELSNSCFTGGIIHCKHGDELRIRNAHPGRYVVLEATKSFFGMFKIAESFQTGP